MTYSVKPIGIYASFPQQSLWRDHDKIEQAEALAQSTLNKSNPQKIRMTYAAAQKWSQAATQEADSLILPYTRVNVYDGNPKPPAEAVNAHAEKLRELSAHCEALTRSQESSSTWRIVVMLVTAAVGLVNLALKNHEVAKPFMILAGAFAFVNLISCLFDDMDSAQTILRLCQELKKVHHEERTFRIESTNNAFNPYWTTEKELIKHEMYQWYSQWRQSYAQQAYWAQVQQQPAGQVYLVPATQDQPAPSFG